MKWLLDLDIQNDLKRLAVFFAGFVVAQHGWLWLGGAPDQSWLSAGGLLTGVGIGRWLRSTHLTIRQLRLLSVTGLVLGLVATTVTGSPLPLLGALGLSVGTGSPPLLGAPTPLRSSWMGMMGLLFGSITLPLLPGALGGLLALLVLILVGAREASAAPPQGTPQVRLLRLLEGMAGGMLACSLWLWLVVPLSLDQEPPEWLGLGALLGYGLGQLLARLRLPRLGSALVLGQGLAFVSLLLCLLGALEAGLLSRWDPLELQWARLLEPLPFAPLSWGPLALLGALVAGGLPALLLTTPPQPTGAQAVQGTAPRASAPEQDGPWWVGLGLGLLLTVQLADLFLPHALACLSLLSSSVVFSIRKVIEQRAKGGLSFGTLSWAIVLPLLALSTLLRAVLLPSVPETAAEAQPVADSSSRPTPGPLRQDRVGQVAVRTTREGKQLLAGRLQMTGRGSLHGEQFAALVALTTCDQARSVRVIHPGLGMGLRTVLSAPVMSVEVWSPSPLRLAGAAQRVEGLKLSDPRLRWRPESVRRWLRAPSPVDLTLALLPPTQLERMHMLTQEGLEQLAALTGQGCVAIQLPLSPGLPLGGILKGFAQAFPAGSVWTAPQEREQLVLLGMPPGQKLSLGRLEQTLRRADVQALAQELKLRDVGALLSRVLFTPDGLKQLQGSAWQDFAPTPSRMTRFGELIGLHEALRPIEDMLVEPEGDAGRLSLVPVLTQALQGHRIWLSLGEQLEEGALAKVVQEAQALQGDGLQSGETLGPLTAPYLERARQLLKDGRADKAEEQLTVARLLNPRDVPTLLLLAEAARLKQDPATQQQWLQEALTLSGQGLEASLALADLYREQGKIAEASSVLSPLLETHGQEPVLLNNLGALYLSRGRLPEAQALFERAVKLNDQLPEAHRGLASVYLKQSRLDAALVEARLAVTQRPDAEGYHLLGQLLLRMGDTAGARAALVECLLREPDHVAARGAMGILYAEAGEYERAREAWQQVLSLEPENTAARQNLERLKQLLEGQ